MSDKESFFRQSSQIRSSDTYDDTQASGVALETGAVNSEDDFNALRSQLKQVIGRTNWYDLPLRTLTDFASPVLALMTALDPDELWALNETSGTTAYEYVHEAHGTWSAAPTREIGSPLLKTVVGVTSQFVTVADADLSAWNLDTDDWSILVWLRSSTATNNGFMGKGTASTDGFASFTTSTTALGPQTRFFDGVGNQTRGVGSTNDGGVSAEVKGRGWTLYQVSYDASTDEATTRSYNELGFTEAVAVLTVVGAFDSAGDFYIGKDTGVLGNWNGDIGPVAKYSRVLTQQEFKAVYASVYYEDKVRVSDADTYGSYLDQKIVGGTNIAVSITNPGGDEQLSVGLTGTQAGFDSTAIHDDTAGEISAVAAKATPVAADKLLIEDSAAANAKKSITIGDIPHDSLSGFVANEHIDWTQSGAGTIHTDNYIEGGAGTDTTAIHDNTAGEIAAITAKATPTTSDYLLIEDAAAANAKKSITIGDLPSGTDELAAVSATDTTPDYLNNKIEAGASIAVSLIGGGGDETLRITYTGQEAGGLQSQMYEYTQTTSAVVGSVSFNNSDPDLATTMYVANSPAFETTLDVSAMLGAAKPGDIVILQRRDTDIASYICEITSVTDQSGASPAHHEYGIRFIDSSGSLSQRVVFHLYTGVSPSLQGPQHLWRMDSTGTMSDVGYEADVSLTAVGTPALLGSGLINGSTEALDYDSGEGHTAADDPDFDLTDGQAKTLSMWFQMDSVTSDMLLAQKNDAGNAGWVLYFDQSADTFRVETTWNAGGAGAAATVAATPTAAIGQLYHVVLRFEYGDVTLFCNGVKGSVNPGGAGGDLSNANTFRIADADADTPGGVNSFDGQMDEVSWFDYALSDYDVQEIYRRDLLPSSGGLSAPGTTTDNALVRWDGTDGTAVQSSSITVSDTDQMSGVRTASVLESMAILGTTTFVDWNDAASQWVVLTSNTAFSFVDPPAGTRLQLRIIQGGSGSNRVGWPTTVRWASGTPPTLSTAGGSSDIVTLFFDGLTYWATGITGFATDIGDSLSRAYDSELIWSYENALDAPPTFRTFNMSMSTDGKSAHSHTLPDGIQAGDLIICAASWGTFTGGTSITDFPSDYVEIQSGGYSLYAALDVFAKVATGAESTFDITLNSTSFSVVFSCIVYQAGTFADTGDLVNDTFFGGATLDAASDTTPNYPAVSGLDNRKWAWVTYCALDGGSGNDVSGASGVTAFEYIDGQATTDSSLAHAYGEQVTASTFLTSGAFSGAAADQSHSYRVAIRPVDFSKDRTGNGNSGTWDTITPVVTPGLLPVLTHKVQTTDPSAGHVNVAALANNVGVSHSVLALQNFTAASTFFEISHSGGYSIKANIDTATLRYNDGTARDTGRAESAVENQPVLLGYSRTSTTNIDLYENGLKWRTLTTGTFSTQTTPEVSHGADAAGTNESDGDLGYFSIIQQELTEAEHYDIWKRLSGQAHFWQEFVIPNGLSTDCEQYLVLWEQAGTQLLDVSGNLKHAGLSGTPTLGAAALDPYHLYAVEGDGSTDYITPSLTTINVSSTTAWTIAGLCRCDADDDGIFSFGSSGNSIGLRTAATGNLTVYYDDGATSTQSITRPTSAFAWCVRRNGTAVDWWVDGVKRTALDLTGNTLTSTTDHILMADIDLGTTASLDGVFQHRGTYSAAFSDAICALLSTINAV